MNDPLNIYNKTHEEITVIGMAISPSGGSISISSSDSVRLCNDPFFMVNLFNSSVGVSVYGFDLGSGVNSAADEWIKRVSAGRIIY